jgi:hypothetical protein
MRRARSSWSWKSSPSGTWTVCDVRIVPPGASTSWTAVRSWSPDRSRVPITTRSTSASAASAFRSGSPPKRTAVALDRTTSDPVPESEVAIASGRLKARKSVSGSGRRMRNGSTTSRTRARASPRESSPDAPPREARSFAIASADAGRSSGRLASAFRITRSAATTAGEPVRAGGSAWSVACRTSTNVRPVNAGRPASISNRMAPAAKRSHLESTASAVTCSGAMYPGVPTMVPVRVSSEDEPGALDRSGTLGLARPKSSSLMPWRVRNTLVGLRSR